MQFLATFHKKRHLHSLHVTWDGTVGDHDRPGFRLNRHNHALYVVVPGAGDQRKGPESPPQNSADNFQPLAISTLAVNDETRRH